MSADPIKPLVFHRSRGGLRASMKPIVVEYHSHKSKSKAREASDNGEKYSSELADLQRAEADLVRVARRATRAVAQGVDTYDRERRHSAEEKKDGAIEDFPHNSAKAMSETLREAADIPVDVAEALAPKNYRRRLRRGFRRASKMLRLFRI